MYTNDVKFGGRDGTHETEEQADRMRVPERGREGEIEIASLHISNEMVGLNETTRDEIVLLRGASITRDLPTSLPTGKVLRVYLVGISNEKTPLVYLEVIYGGRLIDDINVAE